MRPAPSCTPPNGEFCITVNQPSAKQIQKEYRYYFCFGSVIYSKNLPLIFQRPSFALRP